MKWLVKLAATELVTAFCVNAGQKIGEAVGGLIGSKIYQEPEVDEDDETPSPEVEVSGNPR
jgi:hypothetical protein